MKQRLLRRCLRGSEGGGDCGSAEATRSARVASLDSSLSSAAVPRVSSKRRLRIVLTDVVVVDSGKFGKIFLERELLL